MLLCMFVCLYLCAFPYLYFHNKKQNNNTHSVCFATQSSSKFFAPIYDHKLRMLDINPEFESPFLVPPFLGVENKREEASNPVGPLM